MSRKSDNHMRGLSVLFIMFLVLKLCGVIDWSWWWITAPIWIPWVFATLAFIVIFIFIDWSGRR